MAKRSGPKRRKDRGHGPRASQRRDRRREPTLIDEVGTALESDEPLALLSLAGTFLAAFDAHERTPFGRPSGPELPPLDEVVQTFFAVPVLGTSALLAAIAPLSADRVLEQRVRRELVARAHVLPRWLAELAQARPADRVLTMSHVLPDGENILVGAVLPGDHEITAVVYVDHNLGSVVKDAFVVPGSVTELGRMLRSAGDDPDVTLTDLNPAHARARVSEAILHGSLMFPPLETDTWPACRPLVEWVVGMLPDGGRGYERQEWTAADRQALVERFLASPFGSGLGDAEHRELLDDLLWFGTDYGPGDPLRWSPVRVEILLTDWIPRKIVASPRLLAKAPDLLRALIRFGHAECGIRSELTDETLDAVDNWEPEYLETIRSPRLQGPEALLARMGALDPDEALSLLRLRELQRAVGGEHALAQLDDEPLPDEPFAWERVPEDVHGRVSEVLDLVDRCCDALLDTEYRTAARRLLAAVAAGDPEIFRRRGRADTAAGAICWLVTRTNRRFDAGDLQVKQLLGFFGLGTSSVSQRSAVMRQAIGVDPYALGDVELESLDYLTSARRREILAARDRLADKTGTSETPVSPHGG